jgi:hypothetical protein
MMIPGNTRQRIAPGIAAVLLLAGAVTGCNRQASTEQNAGQATAAAAPLATTAAPVATEAAPATTETASATAAGAPATATTAASPTTPQVTLAELGTGDTDDYQIVGAADSFPSSTPHIVCVFTVQGIAAGTTIRGDWIAEDVGSAAPPNTKIGEKTLESPENGTVSGDFVLNAPSGGLAAGKYRLEVYLGDTLAKTMPFTITAGS